jgi:DNA (cytosine-5)-methyltransferase 1
MERSKEDDRIEKGLPVDYICKSLYCVKKVVFSLHCDNFGTSSSCEELESVCDEFEILLDISFVFENVTYNFQDIMYIRVEFFSRV